MDMSIKTVDAFLTKARTWKEEMALLRAIILECDLEEGVKWAKPCYSLGGKNVVLIMPLKERVSLLFFKGALLKDEKKLLTINGENSQSAFQMRFDSAAQIKKQHSAIKAYVKEAIKVEQSGAKIEKTRSTNFDIPMELQQQFHETPALRTAFEALTPGRQRAYVLFISAAKQSATRAARVEKYREQILEGRGMNE